MDMVNSYITSSYRISYHIYVGFFYPVNQFFCVLDSIEFENHSLKPQKKELSYSDPIIYTQFDPPHLYFICYLVFLSSPPPFIITPYGYNQSK